MRIGFLGAGLMGAPMVRRLSAAGHSVTVWNRSPDKARALSDCSEAVEEPSSVANGADIVISMLLDGPITQQVLVNQGVLDALEPGCVVVDMGSVDPPTDRHLAKLCSERGCSLLDAPVSGGVVGAEAGTLSIFVGGDRRAYERTEPVFKAFGRPTHLGPVGAGQLTKLANQLIVAGTIGAVAEALLLAERGGCDPASVRQALMGGFADSRILELHGQRMVDGNFSPGGRSAAQLKDINNALEAASEYDLSLPVGQTVKEAFRDLVESHDGADLDHAAYHWWLKVKDRSPG
ncbi:MAG: NAD(P)-dependent oxidoreductase [Pseudomonadota bacterium]